MNLTKLTVSSVLFCLSVFTLSASVQGESPRDSLDVSSIAAFDPEWLSVYYDGYYRDCPAPEQENGSPDFLRGGQTYGLKSETGESPHSFSLRANLLRWATLTPDVGLEWRISSDVGILVHGSYTSWQFSREAKTRYALWEVNPEVRWYLGGRKAWYVGAMFKAGAFNYKFSGTGRQGDLLGGGITGGYQLRLTNALTLDFSLGLGYVNARCDLYNVVGGVRVRQGSETRHWIGPTHAGVTLVWRIF